MNGHYYSYSNQTHSSHMYTNEVVRSNLHAQGQFNEWDSTTPHHTDTTSEYTSYTEEVYAEHPFTDLGHGSSSGGSSQGSYGGLSSPTGGRVHRVNSDGEGIVLRTSSGQQIMLCDGVVNYEQCIESGLANLIE